MARNKNVARQRVDPTATSMINKENTFIEEILAISEDKENTKPPFVLSFEDMKEYTNFNYVNLDKMADLKYTVPSSRTEMTTRSASVEGLSKSNVHEPRFQVWIAKGPKDFQSFLFSSIDQTKTFQLFLLEFYKEIFPKEHNEIEKLTDKNDIWHVVVIGIKNNDKDITTNAPSWKVISAVSFKPLEDKATIYLSWIATCSLDTERNHWGCTEEDDPFFNGDPFRSGKGMGSFMMSSMQYICKKSTKSKESYNTIFLQSSQQAMGYYRSAVGMHEIAFNEKLSSIKGLIELKIDTPLLSYMHLYGSIKSIRPPNIHEMFFDLKDLMKKSFFQHFCGDKSLFESSLLPDSLKKQPKENALYPSFKNVVLQGSPKRKIVQISENVTDESLRQQYYKNEDRVYKGHLTDLMLQVLKPHQDNGSGYFIFFSREVVGLVLTRMLLFEYFSQISDEHKKFFNTQSAQDLNMLISDQSIMFEAERLFLIDIMWYITKMQHGVDPDRFESNTFYKPETKNGIKKYIDTRFQDTDEIEFSEWELKYMKYAQFLDAALAASPDGNKKGTMNPKRFRDCLGGVYKKLADADNVFDTSQDVILLLLSMIFEVSFVFIKFWKSGSTEREFSYVYKEINVSNKSQRQIYIHTYAHIGSEPKGSKDKPLIMENCGLSYEVVNGIKTCMDRNPRYGIFTHDPFVDKVKELRTKNFEFRQEKMNIHDRFKDIDDAEKNSETKDDLDDDEEYELEEPVESEEAVLIEKDDYVDREEDVLESESKNDSSKEGDIAMISGPPNLEESESKNDSFKEGDSSMISGPLKKRLVTFKLTTSQERKNIFLEAGNDQNEGSQSLLEDNDNENDELESDHYKEEGSHTLYNENNEIVSDIDNDKEEGSQPLMVDSEHNNDGSLNDTEMEDQEIIAPDNNKEHDAMEYEDEQKETQSQLEDLMETDKMLKTQGQDENEYRMDTDADPEGSPSLLNNSDSDSNKRPRIYVPSAKEVAFMARRGEYDDDDDDDDDNSTDTEGSVNELEDSDSESDVEWGDKKPSAKKNPSAIKEKTKKRKPTRRKVLKSYKKKVDEPDPIILPDLTKKEFSSLLKKAKELLITDPPFAAKVSVATGEVSETRSIYTYDNTINNLRIKAPAENQNDRMDFLQNEPNLIGLDRTTIVVNNVPTTLEQGLNDEFNNLDHQEKRLLIKSYEQLGQEVRTRHNTTLSDYKASLKEYIDLYTKTTKKKEKKEYEEQIRLSYEDLQGFHTAMETELYLAHQDSLVALKFSKNIYLKRYQFFGITAKLFKNQDDDQLFRIIIPLTRPWVTQYFKPSFVKAVIQEGNNDGFIHLDDLSLNVTQENIDLARDNKSDLVDPNGGHELAKKRFIKKFRGDTIDDTYYILTLKCVCHYNASDTEPTVTEWKIQSVGKNTYTTANEHNTRYKNEHEWLDIDVGLVMHDDCIGSNIAMELIEDVKAQRRKYLKKKTIPVNDQVTFTSKILDFENGNTVRTLPTYMWGEKQVSSIKYDSNKKTFFGKTILSVYNGKRQTATEVLKEEWVRANFSGAFLNTLKARSDKYLWIPVGTARPNSIYPYKYNLDYPKIVFQQEDRETCVTSSFASCLHYMGMKTFASWVEDFGCKYIEDFTNDQSRLIQQLAESISSAGDASRFRLEWQLKKLNPQEFDVFIANKSNPMLLRLCCSDGSVGHAITVYQGMIFDSNLKYAVDLNKQNLEYCGDAGYLGISFGYECIPIIRNNTPRSKSRVRKKKVVKSQNM
jgi:hypothetical protein